MTTTPDAISLAILYGWKHTPLGGAQNSVPDTCCLFESPGCGRNIYAITGGKFDYTEGPGETTIELKDDLCIYQANHNSSGHFKTVVWKKGVGIVEYSMGYGAMADGFRLKRVRSG